MRFVTIFVLCENVHLIKDVGMIPYVLHKEYKVDSQLVTYNNGDYSYLNDEVKGLKLKFVKRYTKNDFINLVIYLFNNYKNIDVLNFFHTTYTNLLLGYIFKKLNKNGKVYIKMDASERIKTKKQNPYLGKGIKAQIKRKLIRNVDLLTVEIKDIHSYLNNLWDNKVEYIPNGFYDRDYNYEEVQREKIILFVGRVGAKEKANEVLIDAFIKVHSNLDGWKLKFIGPIEKEFNNYIEMIFLKFPEIKSKIDFCGPINDRNELEMEYKKAKIFCLTSRNEGFPLVYLEALRSGLYIITSSILAAKDIVSSEKIGSIFNIDNIDELSEKLLFACNNLNIDHNHIKKYARDNFRWQDSCRKILKYLD